MTLASINAKAKSNPRQPTRVFFQTGRHGARIYEAPEFRLAAERRRREGHHRHCAHDDHDDSQPEVEPLVSDEARGDPLVDDIALLEEELPWRDGGANDRDDEQHDLADLGVLWKARHGQVPRDFFGDRRMDHEKDRNEQETARAERQREPFKSPEISRAYGRHDGEGGQRDSELLGDPEVVERQRDADEVTIVRAFSRKRSTTLKVPQNLPKRSKMSRAWPTPVTAPRRRTIS
jgi:hypothetical protein